VEDEVKKDKERGATALKDFTLDSPAIAWTWLGFSPLARKTIFLCDGSTLRFSTTKSLSTPYS